MQIGFVSAILADLSLEEVLAFAAEEGFDTVELMCWPPGGAERRYAGVTHIDVTRTDEHYANHIRDLMRIHNVHISGLGYYPNPLDPDPDTRDVVRNHLKLVIQFAAKIGVKVVNSFIGRDPNKMIEDQIPLMKEVWGDLLQVAKQYQIQIGIENCPMIFSRDEWPGGKNLAISPAAWRMIFETFPDSPIGLNFDPSHTVWQMIDYCRCLKEFGNKLVHIHAKDERIDRDKLHEVGIMGLGWHIPKLPGLGEVDWGAFFAALTETGYRGPVVIEVEDRAYEGSLEDRKRSLRQSKRYLQQFMG